MTRFLTWGVLALLITTLSSLALILINQAWVALPLVGVNAGCTLMLWLLARANRSAGAAERLVKLAEEAYRRDLDWLTLSQIVEATRDPRIQQAQREARMRQQQVWDARYARGEQHDY